MTNAPRISRADILALTEARLTYEKRGQALDTQNSLRFSLDHARAREAVLSEMDVEEAQRVLSAADLSCRMVTSMAKVRDVFIKRPDLGRRLADSDAQALRGEGPVDVALVLGDGLSAIAVALNGSAFVAALAHRLLSRGLSIGPVILARQARVALADQIALAMQAGTVVMALGERPGLTAADSLGVYVTHGPARDTQDSRRNCISNIRDGGTSIDAAVRQAEQLILAMRQTGLSGVQLNQSRGSRTLPSDTA